MARGAIYGLTAASIWGGMYVVSDIVLETIPPFTLLTVRLLLGAAVLALFVWRASGLSLPPRREALRFGGVGVVGFGVSVGAQFVGTDLSNAVNGALVTSASPAFILVFAVVLLGERLTVRRLAAVALATVGVLVIIDPAQADFSAAAFVGNLVLAFAAVTWGLYSVLVRKVSVERDEITTDTLLVTLVAFLGGLLLTVPLAGVELMREPMGDITPGIALGILYLGVVSTAGALWLWNRAFALVEASTASLFFFAQPLAGAALGALIGQPVTVNLAAGGALIAAGVALALTGAGGAMRLRPGRRWMRRRAVR